MEHREGRALAADYVAGVLEGRHLQRFAAHLATCPACQREVETYWHLQGALRRQVRRRMAQDQPSPAVVGRVLDAVRGAHQQRQGLWERVKSRVTMFKAGLASGLGSVAAAQRLRRALVPALVVATAVVAGLVLVLQPFRSSDTLALSLDTPVRGTFTVTEGAPVVSGAFEYETADRWRRQMTLHGLPEGERYVEEVQVATQRYQRFSPGDAWDVVDGLPPEFGPFPGLAEFGPPARLFEALLQLYKLERKVTTEAEGQRITLYQGLDTGYAQRLKQRLEGSVAPEYLEERYRWYTQYPPRVWLYADSEHHILSVVLVVLSPEAAQPTVTAIKIAETSAPISITVPEPTG